MTTPNSNTPARLERGAHLRWVNVSDITINPLAQREYKPAHAEHIATNFDPDAFQYPVLSLRGGKFYCVDGQHTIGALRLMGWDDQQVQCVVHEGLTESQEADLFLKLNDRKTIRAFDNFRIAVVAERSDEVDIERIVLSNHLTISESRGIGAVTALRKVYTAGPPVLGRTLRLIRDGFGDAGFEANVIRGVGQVCARYNGEVDDKAAIEKLTKVRGGVNGLLGKARQIRAQFSKPIDQCVAAAFVEIYNSGRGGKKLPSWWKS